MDSNLAEELTVKIPQATSRTMQFIRQMVDMSAGPWKSFVGITALYVAREIIDRQLQMNFKSDEELQHGVEHVARFFMQHVQVTGVVLVDANGTVTESSGHGEA